MVQSVSSQPSGEALFEYDYVLRLRGEGRLQALRDVMARFPSARLAGAFEPR
jgi:hypothetical protein